LQSLGRFEQSLKTHLARNARTGTGAGADTGDASTVATAVVELGDPQPIIGLDGYSPVALVSHRQWTRGKHEFAWEHKGITYYLASRAEFELFRKTPEEFAPKLLGCDPVILSETDRAVPGDTRYGAFFDGDLYLFQSSDTRQRFKTNPPRYTRIQHVLRVDHIERTAVR
jgi:YHS domain-containing protein